MIPFDFDYYKPDSLDQTIKLYHHLAAQYKKPLYYGGGTEIISMARANNISTKAVIDLKAIPECKVLEIQDKHLVIGSAVTLSGISESKLFPLLEKSCGRIADHTVQGKITLGGNIAGTIIYRETTLPLLLTDSEVIIAGADGQRKVPFREVFDEKIHLQPGEFLVQFMIKKEYLHLPYAHIKKTKNEKIDYPLLSVAALKKEKKLRVAFSGLSSFPFRSLELEEELNKTNYAKEERVKKALEKLSAPILTNISGGSQYRRFVLENTLLNILEALEEVK